MRNNVFIEIDKDTYLIWKDGYDSLESLANELFPIYLFAELSPRDFDPLSEYWLSLFRNLGNAEETTNRYFGIANGLISKFVDLLSDIRDYQLRQEIHNALIIVVNKFFELIHNKEKIARLNLLCFHQSMHLMWQYIDLSYSQNDQVNCYAQRLYYSACNRLRKAPDYIFYSILRGLEMASLGVNVLSKCLPIPNVDNILWAPKSRETDLLRDELLDGIKYADMAYAVPAKSIDHAAGEVADVLLQPMFVSFIHEAGRDVNGYFHYPCNLNGYVAMTHDDIPTIIVGYSGTENAQNWFTNIYQFIFGPDLTYTLAAELLSKVVATRNEKFKDSQIRVYGHSLGGGLMQYAISTCRTGNIRGYGYNSAGVSLATYEKCTYKHYDSICHLYQPNDIVFPLPFTYQIGTAVRLDNAYHGIKNTHGLDVIRRETGAKGMEVAEIE